MANTCIGSLHRYVQIRHTTMDKRFILKDELLVVNSEHSVITDDGICPNKNIVTLQWMSVIRQIQPEILGPEWLGTCKSRD